MAALSGPAWGQGKQAITLPAPASLAGAADAARQLNQPLLILVSLEGCPFCQAVRQSYLLPLQAEGLQPVVQVDMRSNRPLLDFAGQPSTHAQQIQAWRIKLAPTLLFVGPGGRELAPRLVGASLPDFYGSYLEQRLDAARLALR
jgi:hypothetical protein